MKPITRISAALLLAASPLLGAEQSLLGKISDSCAAKAGAPAPAADCKGPKYVFTARGKTYAIANPEYPGVAERLDKMAKVNADVNGDAITIKSIVESHAK